MNIAIVNFVKNHSFIEPAFKPKDDFSEYLVDDFNKNLLSDIAIVRDNKTVFNITYFFNLLYFCFAITKLNKNRPESVCTFLSELNLSQGFELEDSYIRAIRLDYGEQNRRTVLIESVAKLVFTQGGLINSIEADPEMVACYHSLSKLHAQASYETYVKNEAILKCIKIELDAPRLIPYSVLDNYSIEKLIKLHLDSITDTTEKLKFLIDKTNERYGQLYNFNQYYTDQIVQFCRQQIQTIIKTPSIKNFLDDRKKKKIDKATDFATSERPLFKKEQLSQVYDLLKDYFSEDEQEELFNLLENGKSPNKKLYFKDSGNKIGHAFKELHDRRIILGCNKTELEKWVATNFIFKHRKEQKEFSEDYINKIISRNSFPCKSPILEIIQEGNKYMILPAKR